VFEVIFAPAAAAELVEAHDWYETELPGLGLRFRAEDEAAGCEGAKGDGWR
jgi:hypothetical protein